VAFNSAALGEAKQRGAGSDLDVIGVGCKAHQFEWAYWKAQLPHGNVDLSS
jgi:hypothetical protein